MNYRLLIDFEALEFLSGLKKSSQRLLQKRLRQIQDDPIACSDYMERDPSGRPLHVSIADAFAITYWEDFADRHVKVLEIARADR